MAISINGACSMQSSHGSKLNKQLQAFLVHNLLFSKQISGHMTHNQSDPLKSEL